MRNFCSCSINNDRRCANRRRAAQCGARFQSGGNAKANAIAKKNPLILWVCETSGAISPEGHAALGHLARQVRKPGHRDGTVYGTNRGAPKGPKGFRAHHTARISSAVVYADAECLLAYGDGTMGA